MARVCRLMQTVAEISSTMNVFTFFDIKKQLFSAANDIGKPVANKGENPFALAGLISSETKERHQA